MAVKDCIKLLRKVGHKVELHDRRALKKYVDSGLTDEQAVSRLLLDATVELVEVTDRVAAEGVEVETGRGKLAEIRDFRTEKLRSMMGERKDIVDKIEALEADYKLLKQDREMFDELLSKGLGFETSFDELTESELKMHIGQLLLRATTTELDPKNRGRIWPEDRFRVAMERDKIAEVQGTTPDEIYDSRVKLETKLAENRKSKQLLEQDRLEAQRKIDSGFKPETTRDLFQGPIDDDFQEFEGAQVDTDQGRIAAMLGPHLYGDQNRMVSVTIKELFQNAFDATRSAVDKGQVEEGLIDVNLSDDGYTVTVTDNGVGMTSDMMRKGLLTIGGTGKEGEVNSGGFGIAKMLFLFGADTIKVETVRDGVKSTISTTGQAMIANAKDSSLPLDPTTTADRAIKREKTDEPNGTKVTVEIPKEYTDQNSGEAKTIDKGYDYKIRDMFENQLLHPKVRVTNANRNIKAGAEFAVDDFDSIGTIQFEWGSADILVSKSQTEDYGENIRILNNGLIQFEDTVTENPFKLFSSSIPRKFVIDLHPNDAPEGASYPFELNRQSLRDHAKKDVDRLKMYFSARYREDKFADTAEGYGKLVALDENNKASEQIDIAPVVPEDDTSGLTAGIDPNANIEVVNGVLMVNGEEQQELTEDDIGRLSFDVSKYKIDQSRVPANQPLIHSQMSFKEDTFAFPDRLVDGQTQALDIGGREVNEVLYEIFGEDRVNGYFGDVGRVLVRMKNLIAEIGDDRFTGDIGLEQLGVGVSILGSGFYGVHTAVPARMIFINPGADPHDMDSTVAKRDDLTVEQRMQLIASSMMTTMVHEIAHYVDMNHDGKFIFALEGVYALLDNTPTVMTELREAMRKTLRENYDIYQFIEGQFQADALEVTGLSLKDVGTQQARDDVGPADDAGERDADTGRPTDAATDRPSDRPTGQELDDERLSAGIRPDGIVVPEGSVHPQAGEGGALLEGQKQQANLDAFMEGSHVVNEDGSPQIVYHGTQFTDGIEVFEPRGGFGGWNNLGTWASSQIGQAEKLTPTLEGPDGPVMELYMSIKNPLETDWDTLQNEISTAIENHNADNPDATPLTPWSGTREVTSTVGKFLNEHFKSLGYDGIIIRDFDGDGQPTQDVFVALDSNQIKSATDNQGEFDRDDPNILHQDERGKISFNEARKGFIEILASGDASTFIHETGHMYLEVMRWAAQQPNAPEQILQDWESIKAYTGATDTEISTEAHEKFANSFEIYALEGKAPSVALQDSFNAFRSWMLYIYNKLKGIGGVHLNDEIRGVFDRMLASDAEIAIAEQTQGYVALFADAETAGMTQEQFDYYSKWLTRAHNDAVDKESRRMIDAMKRDETAAWKEERAKIVDEVEAQAMEMRVYVALAHLQKGKMPDGSPVRGMPVKIDKKSLMDLLSHDQETLNRLPRPFIYTLEGGTDVNVVATKLGYASAHEMIDEIANAPKMQTYIEVTADRIMHERNPDPLTDGTLAENAVRAVHSEGRLRILNAELRQLRKMMAEDRPAVRAAERGKAREDREAREANKAQLPKRAEMAMLKAGARAKVEAMRIRDIKPHVYLRAEQKAGREAFEAMEKRDYAKAYAAKMRQIINHEMYRASVALRKEMDSTRTFLARYEGPRKQRQLAKAGVLDQIKTILENIELRKVSLAQVDRDNAMKQLKQAVLDGRLVVTQATMAKIMDESTNWQEFTPAELRGMKDVIKQIEHGAVMEDKMTVNGELVDYQDIENEVVESITENNKVIKLRPGGQQSTKERGNNRVDQGIMTWLRPSSIARVLDGAGFGAITRRIIVPMRRAYAEKLIPMLHQAQRDVAGFYNKHYTMAELGQMSKRMYKVEALDDVYSKSELLSMALNWGNEGNRQAVLGGQYEGKQVFSEQAVKQMLGHLTAKDWAFVQDIWDYNDTYREQIFDAEERRRGIRPEKVEATAFTQRTADGETIVVRGGYHPLRYDRAFDPRSDRRESPDKVVDDISKQLQHVAVGASVTANTRAGSTYNRVKNHGRVVRLGLNIIDSHLREVIRDIAVGDEVLHIKRLLESGGIKRAMIDTNNQAALEALDLWLTDAAVGELPAEGVLEVSASWIRTGFTKAKLGWNFTVMFLQFTGMFQTIAVIGTRSFAAGFAKYLQNPAAAHRTAMEVSSFLNTRYQVGAFDKDVQDTKAIVESEFGNMPTRTKRAINVVGSTLFAGIAACQKVVDIVTWMGAYQKGLNDEMLSEADAIIYADTQVEAAQTSGFFSDRSGFERGTTGLRKNRQSQMIRIWTTLISYMLAKSNIAYEKYKDTDMKDPKQVMDLVYDLIMLYMVEGIASALLYQRLPEDDDEPEDWALWALAQSGESMVAGIPFVREIAAARFGGGNTPIGVFSNDALRVIDQVAQGEADWAAIDATLDVAGTALHLPTGQMSKTGRKLWEDGLTSDEWWEYFSGPRD